MRGTNQNKFSGFIAIAALSTQFFLASLLGGCAGYKPLAVGSGYLGIGAYKDYHKAKKDLIPYVDLRGAGVLILTDGLILGYLKISILYKCKHLKNARIKLSQAEIAFGNEANLMAKEIINKQHKKGGEEK